MSQDASGGGPSEHRVKAPTRPVAPSIYRLALLGVVLVLVVIAYYPFGWDPPRYVTNGVTRSMDGYLQFAEMNNARTQGTPAWLPSVRRFGVVDVRVVFEPRSADESAPIMMLASNFWDTDFAIGQDGSVLLVWVRHPGTDANGDPPFGVGGVVHARQWNVVDVILQHDQLRVDVDGSTQLLVGLPARSVKVWGPGQIALGNQVHGGGAWQGNIRLASVTTPGFSVNYVLAGALSVPRRYFYFPDHVIPFPPSDQDWLDFSADMLSFIPVGFLIVYSRRPPVPAVPAALLSTLVVVVLAAGKFLFHGRHTSVVMVVMEAIGGLLGVLLACQLQQLKRGAVAN